MICPQARHLGSPAARNLIPVGGALGSRFRRTGLFYVRLELAPATLGEPTVEVLTEVGLARREVDALIASGTAKAVS